MKARLEFDMEDLDDAIAHFRCIKALDLAMVLYDLDEKLRVLVKHADGDRVLHLAVDGKDVAATPAALDAVRTVLHDLMHDRGLDLEALVR